MRNGKAMEKRENGMPRLHGGLPSEDVLPKNARNAGGTVQLGSVYAPMQSWQMLYTPEQALKHGTMFEELYKPLEVSRNG